MAIKEGLQVVGDKLLAKRLVALENRVGGKLIPKAARESAKVTLKDYRKRAPKLTGLMRRAVSVRTFRKKHKVDTGKTAVRAGKTFNVKRIVSADVGASVAYNRQRYFKLLMESGRKMAWDKKRNERWMYPHIVEYGTKTVAGKRPLTKALFENKAKILRTFVRTLRQLRSLRGAT